MSKQLYEEALADVKRVREVAEDNAKRAVLEAVMPRIRELVDRELMSEAMDIGDDVEGLSVQSPESAISVPDADGKVTLDLDAVKCPPQPGVVVAPPQFGTALPVPGDEYEVSLEAVNALKATKLSGTDKMTLRIATLGESVKRTLTSAKKGSVSPERIATLVSEVEDTYSTVQAIVVDQTSKSIHEEKLEALFKDLTSLQEQQTMAIKTNKQKKLAEADVTLKLTGLPDETDIDTVGVDLVTGEEEDGGDALAEPAPAGDDGAADMGAGGEGGELDFGKDDEDQMEAHELSDDTIVEIDAGMLRREIARMRSLREDAESGQKPASWGDGVGAKEMDDFGGASEEGEPLDVKARDVAKISKPLGEADDQMDEADDDDQMDEADDELDEFRALPVGRNSRRHGEERVGSGLDDQDAMDQGSMTGLDEEDDDLDQLQNRRKKDVYGDGVADGHETATWDKRRHESLTRRADFEKRLQERARRKAASLKTEARGTRNSKKLAELKQQYAATAKRYNESLSRSKGIARMISESTKAGTKNGTATPRTETGVEKHLRAKLAETNLFNAKLVYTNRLLQNERLSAKAKSQIVKRLDEAKNVREAKMVYESLMKRLSAPARSLSEGANQELLGSASRASQPGSTPVAVVAEGVEAARWAKLAGIGK